MVKLWARPAIGWKLIEECGSNPPRAIEKALISKPWEAWECEGLGEGMFGNLFITFMGFAHVIWWISIFAIPACLESENRNFGVCCSICACLLPWMIYHSILVLYYNSNFDLIKREEAELRSVAGLFSACIDDQYSQILSIGMSQSGRIEQYEAKHRLLNIISLVCLTLCVLIVLTRCKKP